MSTTPHHTAASVPALVCVGETMALVTPQDAGLTDAVTATIGLAGAESNVAVGVAAAGHRAAWASRLGADPLGARIASELSRRGVDLWTERDVQAQTGVMFKDPGVDGSSTF